MVREITSLAEFNTTIERNKVVVVDFFATWCGPCKVIAPKYEALSKEYKQVVFLKVDVDKARDISTTAGVTAMPTFIVYKDGKKDKTIKGADARGLENAIRSAAGPPSQNASGTHNWGSGQTLGSAEVDSQKVNANPTEVASRAFGRASGTFKEMDSTVRTIIVLLSVYLLYAVFVA